MKRLISILIIAVIFTIPAYLAYCEDKTDKLNQDSSYTFSPGYVNAAKYQAESLKVKMPDYKEKGFFEKAVDYVKAKMGNNAKQQQAASQNPNPVLQQKTSGSNPEASATSSATQLISSASSNVAIGTGADQVRDASGRLISEVIGGQRYVYAGFDNVGTGTITAAIALANLGDAVVVRARDGVYQEGPELLIRNGVNLLGGYSEDGVRSFQTTTTIKSVVRAIGITAETEISGFTIDGNFGYTGVAITNSNILFTNNRVINSTSDSINITLTGTSYSKVTLQNNVFESPWRAVSVYTSRSWSSPTYKSDVISMNNNYIASQGIGVYGMMSYSSVVAVSSTNDYFVGIADAASRIGAGNIVNQRQSADSGGLIRIDAAPSTQTSSPVSIELLNPYAYNHLNDTFFDSVSVLGSKTSKPVDSDTRISIFKGFFAKEADLGQGKASQIDPALLAKMLEGTLSQAMYLPGAQISPEDMEAAMKLSSILSNPTEDQKVVIDSITSLLNDMENLQKETGANPELAKASSDLLQMVANVLLAQAIPDLLKEGDMQGIKGIFSQLDSSKSKVILEYKEATKPYYEEVKKLIEKNASVLDIDLNLKNLIQKELKEIPRSEIDKILEKLKAKANKSFEEEYILQQEEKAKAKYIDPNKKKLEENMKKMLEDFTKKLSVTLEAKK